MNTQIADPYPPSLADLDPEPITANPDAVTNRLITAINRLATAIEQDALSRLHPVGNAPQPAQNVPQAFAPLPPVQVVSDKPSCPYHGNQKVAPSTNGKGGFYCQSKASLGQPANPKGYCTWHS